MFRLSTLVRWTGGIQRQLRRSSGVGETFAAARVVEVPNGLRGLHSKGTPPPPSDKQGSSFCNGEHRNHIDMRNRMEQLDVNPSLDRQLLYEEEEPEEEGVAEGEV